MPPTPSADRRTALRERHRRALLDAAAELMAEAGGAAFTVDELAARADVARRTVFNHFASLDDVVTTVCTEVLSGVVDVLLDSAAATPAEPLPGAGTAMFDELAHALRTTDLVGPMAFVTRALDDPDENRGRAGLLLRSMHELSAHVADAMAQRHPGADPLDVRVLVNSLVSGLVVLHEPWFAATGGSADEHSRRVWADLLDRLVTNVRRGYGGGPAA